MDWKRQELRKSGLNNRGKAKHSLAASASDLGQCYPQQNPHPADAAAATFTEPLGIPLTIREVAGIVGVSQWTIRQRYLPAGLPYHRLTPNGKLIFYRNQVIRWLITRQQKGGPLS